MANLTRAQRHNRMLENIFDTHRKQESAKSPQMKLADKICQEIYTSSSFGATYQERGEHYAENIKAVIEILNNVIK